MDHVSLRKAERLYWLGRYAERAYTVSCLLMRYYDRMIDLDQNAYLDFCLRLGIADRYLDKNDFIRRIITDAGDNASITFALKEANDNAMVLRDEIKTESAAYMQLAYNNALRCFTPECRICDLQKIKDSLLAFWGALDDYILNADIRNLIRIGKYTERIDLYTRFAYNATDLQGAESRLLRNLSQLERKGANADLALLFHSDKPLLVEEIDRRIINMLQ